MRLNRTAKSTAGRLAAVCLAAIVGGYASLAQAEPKGSIVVAVPTLSQHVDPTTTISTADWIMSSMLYDGLIDLGSKGKHPGLAESWTISKDGKQVDFHLRKGVTFQNGDPFTADDVKFTFEKVMAPDSTHGYRKGFQDSIERIDVVDPHLVRFILKEPWPAFFTTARYALQHIVPKKYYESVGAKAFEEKPIGTGPFKLVDKKAGEWSKFEANPTYWAGAPHVKTVTLQLVKEAFTRYAMLERGEADITTGLTGPLMERVLKNPSFRVIVSKYAGTNGMMFNKELFPEAKDVRVRKAFAYAMNRKLYAEKILGGMCEPASEIYTPSTFGYLPGQPQIPYDPAKAKALLKEAGVKPGTKITFVLHTASFAALPSAPQVLEAIAGDLESVGFKVERVPYDSGAWLAMMRGHKQPMVYYTPSGTPDDGGELINTYYATTSAWSSRSVNRPEYDALFKEQLQEPDPAKREALLHKFVKMEEENVENIPLLWCHQPFAVGKRIKSWEPGLSSGYYMNLQSAVLAN